MSPHPHVDAELRSLCAKHITLLRELGGVLGNVSPYGKTQAQRTKQNRIRAKQRAHIKNEIRNTERAIVARALQLCDPV